MINAGKQEGRFQNLKQQACINRSRDNSSHRYVFSMESALVPFVLGFLTFSLIR